MDDYSFDKIGKKMPYRVPGNFFDEVENTIIARALTRHNKRNTLKIFYRIMAVAATFALILVFVSHDTANDKTDFAEIAQAFDDLSDADQTYLLEIYQDDIFINE